MNNVPLQSTTRVTSCERVDRGCLVPINGENMGSVKKEIDWVEFADWLQLQRGKKQTQREKEREREMGEKSGLV